MKQFDVVKVTAIRGHRFEGKQVFYKPTPLVGDIGTVLEVYEDACEVECSDSGGTTIWLEAMYTDELGPVDTDWMSASDFVADLFPISRLRRLASSSQIIQIYESTGQLMLYRPA
jgi:hypothetical protein